MKVFLSLGLGALLVLGLLVAMLTGCAAAPTTVKVVESDGTKVRTVYYRSEKNVKASLDRQGDDVKYELSADSSPVIDSKTAGAAGIVDASGSIAGTAFTAGLQAAQSYFGSQLQANSVEIEALKEQNKRLERELKALKEPAVEEAPDASE